MPQVLKNVKRFLTRSCKPVKTRFSTINMPFNIRSEESEKQRNLRCFSLSSDLILSFFAIDDAHVTFVAVLINDVITYSLTNSAAFLVDVQAIGVDAFAEVRAKLDKA